MRSSLRILAALLTLAALAGCDSDGRTRPPPTEVRMLNVAPSHANLFFFREERNTTGQEGAFPFGGGRSFTFDSDTYDFSVRLVRGSWELAPTTLAETRQAIDETNRHYLVATEAGGAVELLYFAQPVAEDTATLNIVHAAESQPAFDAYFVAPGTDPAAATPVGSIAFREAAYTDSVATGDGQLVLTAAGDPATVLFRSDTVVVPDAATLLVAIAEENGLGTSPFGVYIADSSSQRLVDTSQAAAIRIINGASDMAPRDVYLDGDFTTPFVAAAAFGEIGAYQPLAAGTPELTLTPAGNPSVEEATVEPTIVPGRRYTTIIGGNPTDDDVRAVTIIEDHRSIDGVARVEIVNSASAFDTLYFYFLDPGTSLDGLSQTATLTADIGNVSLTLEPKDYELTIRDPATSTIVAGPMALTLGAGSLQGILSTDASGGSTVDVLVYDPRSP